jgi:hypothetical protein
MITMTRTGTDDLVEALRSQARSYHDQAALSDRIARTASFERKSEAALAPRPHRAR